MDPIFIPDETPRDHLFGLPAVVGPQTRVLILGSMPGTMSLQCGEYYAAPRNRFWPVVAAVLGVDLPRDYKDRVLMLEHLGIGLWDVLASCRRRGASDSSIQDGVPNDLASFLAAHPRVATIALNGTKAAELFRELVAPDVIAGRRVLSLPSTSAANARLNLERLVEAWSQILA